MKYGLRSTEDGFMQVDPLPSQATLEAYYRELYYSSPDLPSQYTHGYTPEELEHKYLPALEMEHLLGSRPQRMFELGFGEGFLLDYFDRRGWPVGGIDFSSEAVTRFFPKLATRLEYGDLFELTERKRASGVAFDVLVCNNVLEHVREPERMVRNLVGLVTPGGVCRLQVPNDGSWLQAEVVQRGQADDNYWLRPPEHLSYFTIESLRRLLDRTGWRIVEVLGDFPIDMFLLNPDSGYERDRSRGRNSHFARVAFELALARRSSEALVAFRRGCAAAGLGRNLIVYITPDTAQQGPASTTIEPA